MSRCGGAGGIDGWRAWGGGEVKGGGGIFAHGWVMVECSGVGRRVCV